jgi:predicted alpha/beta superfamily hydrolase
MHAILNIECNGHIEDGEVPFISAPFPELGGGDPRKAPTLVRTGRNRWRLDVAVQGVGSVLDPSGWKMGVRSVDLYDFQTGSGLREAETSLTWRFALRPGTNAQPMRLHYCSGWTHVTACLIDRDREMDVALEAEGPGRSGGETLWTAELPVHDLSRDWGFFLRGPGRQTDRPPGGGLYRPLGTSIHLADGELFSAPPPAQRSAPWIESVDVTAPEMDHTFRIHVVLPRDYAIYTDRAYPLVYLNDGQNQLTDQGAFGGWHTDRTAARLMREGRMQEAVLAAVEMHPDRNRAFFPQGELSTPHGQADIYTQLLAGRVREALHARYRLLQEPMTIIGSSNGAIHALFAGLSRPDAFGGIGCLSYAVMRPERNVEMIERSSRPPLGRAYLDCGTRWGESDDESQSHDNVPITYALRELLLQRGMILEENLRFVLGYGDAHNERAWRRRIAGCLEFLLPPA